MTRTLSGVLLLPLPGEGWDGGKRRSFGAVLHPEPSCPYPNSPPAGEGAKTKTSR